MSVRRPAALADDRALEIAMARVLRAGVRLAACLVGAGAVVYLARHGGEAPSVRRFQGEPAALREWRGILGLALHGRGRGLIQSGLLVLIATPVVRVAAAMAVFAARRDRLYVAVSAFVLLVLLCGVSGVLR